MNKIDQLLAEGHKIAADANKTADRLMEIVKDLAERRKKQKERLNKMLEENSWKTKD